MEGRIIFANKFVLRRGVYFVRIVVKLVMFRGGIGVGERVEGLGVLRKEARVGEWYVGREEVY